MTTLYSDQQIQSATSALTKSAATLHIEICKQTSSTAWYLFGKKSVSVVSVAQLFSYLYLMSNKYRNKTQIGVGNASSAPYVCVLPIASRPIPYLMPSTFCLRRVCFHKTGRYMIRSSLWGLCCRCDFFKAASGKLWVIQQSGSPKRVCDASDSLSMVTHTRPIEAQDFDLSQDCKFW